MRNKGLIIFLIILLIIIIMALVGFLVLCLNGTIDLRNFNINFGSRKSENLIYKKDFDIETINFIDVKHDAGDVIFENSEENNIKVEIYGENSEDFEVELNENELKIDYTKNNKGGFFNFGKVTGDIKVFVPETFKGNIKIENDAGQVKTKNLGEASLDVDCDAGNVEIGKIKNIKAKCDAGNIGINNVLNKCDIKVDCGNVDIKKVELKENSTIKSNMGNINIDETNDIFIDADVDLGKNNIENNNRKSNITLKIDCDLGNVNVK